MILRTPISMNFELLRVLTLIQVLIYGNGFLMYLIPHFGLPFVLDNVISDQQQNELNEGIKGNKRIECLSQNGCTHVEERCCYTFLDPRSKCYKICPARWKEIVNGNNSLLLRPLTFYTFRVDKHQSIFLNVIIIYIQVYLCR